MSNWVVSRCLFHVGIVLNRSPKLRPPCRRACVYLTKSTNPSLKNNFQIRYIKTFYALVTHNHRNVCDLLKNRLIALVVRCFTKRLLSYWIVQLYNYLSFRNYTLPFSNAIKSIWKALKSNDSLLLKWNSKDFLLQWTRCYYNVTLFLDHKMYWLENNNSIPFCH